MFFEDLLVVLGDAGTYALFSGFCFGKHNKFQNVKALEKITTEKSLSNHFRVLTNVSVISKNNKT